MKQREFLLLYLINTRTQLENDVKQLQNTLLRRQADCIDCLELMLALERLNCFNEYAQTTCEILRLEQFGSSNFNTH